MKYIILREPDGSEFPVFCLAPQTHAELAAAWQSRGPARRPVAAGFVEFLASGAAIVFGYSDSLRLGPRPADAALITAMHMGTVTMARVTEARGVRGPREISPALREEISACVARLHPGHPAAHSS